MPQFRPGEVSPKDLDQSTLGNALVRRRQRRFPVSSGGHDHVIGRVTTYCVTAFKYGNDYIGRCTVTLYTPQGVFVATGEINESALERYVPQTLNTHRGTLTVQQIVYPNVFRLTLRLN